MFWIIFLLFVIVLCVALLVLCVKRISQLIDAIDRLDTQIEESLDILNDAYREISKAARTEVLSDEPIVRQVMSSIKSARDAVLLVARKLVTFDESNSKETE